MTEVTLSMPPWSCNPRITNSIFIDEYRLFFAKLIFFLKIKLYRANVSDIAYINSSGRYSDKLQTKHKEQTILGLALLSLSLFSICLLLLFDYKYGVGTALVGKFVEDFTVFPHLRSVIRALLFHSCHIYITVVYYYG